MPPVPVGRSEAAWNTPWTNNRTFGAEYLYYNLGSRHLMTAPNVAASNFFGAAVYSDTKVNFDGSIIRAARQLQVLTSVPSEL